ncbi:MAG: hypothetical protein CVU71_05040 [Deltaproteobacteria bacterium HGW-Deltaproteobacteria-6]|jgi:hypothetical protein|nr:MAG: hypothetical protein CVU71_05040 [Deltaproteobacteria bacterium HGW-Deltaproteobacteria-6]
MKIIYTKIIPLHKYAAVNLFGILLAPKGSPIAPETINHEVIHTLQMKEMLYVFFYLWYAAEWLIRLFGRGSAYRNIAFEKEAYDHEHDEQYPGNRKAYHWLKYL